jgi:F-type H+-transporting ATPase subunit epsilon
MHLKILLPFRIFADQLAVSQIIAETSEGSFGMLPHRLDCVAALTPGILTYETERGEKSYVAVDEGVIVKAGRDVLVSVRNAVAGKDLNKLRETIEREFRHLDEQEKSDREVLAKLESGLIHQLVEFQRE